MDTTGQIVIGCFALAVMLIGVTWRIAEMLTRPKTEKVGTVTEIVIFPLKSARGIKVKSATIGPHGLLFDRLWMLVDADGSFLSQRRVPKLATVEVDLPESEDAPLRVRAKGAKPLEVPVVRGGATKSVRVWDDRMVADDQGDVAAAWFASVLGLEGCRLMRMSERATRPCDARYTPTHLLGVGLLGVGATPMTAFSDGFPVLLASEASLADLNARLVARGKRAVPMDRFRPNITVAGRSPALAPFAEDGWTTVRVGEARGSGGCSFAAVKPCSRCKMPTIDQKTGKPDGASAATRRRAASPARRGEKTRDEDDDEGGGPAAEAEPTTTLATFRSGAWLGYRKREWKAAVFFGQNLVCVSRPGSALSVGDEVHAAPRRPPSSLFWRQERVKGVDY